MNGLTLFELISQVESNDNHYAIRFEPTTYDRQAYFTVEVTHNIIAANVCSHETARMISSTSWGAIQIMGFNLYSGVAPAKASIGMFLEFPSLQEVEFERYIKNRDLNFTPQNLLSEEHRLYFALKYNGAKAYADRILAALKHFGIM